MEAKISTVIDQIDAAGGMYAAVESGQVQHMIGESAIAWQDRIDSGEQPLVGVNCYAGDNDELPQPAPYRPDPSAMAAHVEALKTYKAERSETKVRQALDALARSPEAVPSPAASTACSAVVARPMSTTMPSWSSSALRNVASTTKVAPCSRCAGRPSVR